MQGFWLSIAAPQSYRQTPVLYNPRLPTCAERLEPRQDRSAIEALYREKYSIVAFRLGRQYLITLNRLSTYLIYTQVDPVVKVAIIAWSEIKRRNHHRFFQEEIIQQMRVDSIKHAHDEECKMSD